MKTSLKDVKYMLLIYCYNFKFDAKIDEFKKLFTRMCMHLCIYVSKKCLFICSCDNFSCFFNFRYFMI